MKVGYDYWNVISAYPRQIAYLIDGGYLYIRGWHEVHIISAIGKARVGTIKEEVEKVLSPYTPPSKYYTVHEVVFEHPRESPQLKLEKCQELGIEIFYDDRKDVVDLLNANGILAFLVPRDGALSDERAEQ